MSRLYDVDCTCNSLFQVGSRPQSVKSRRLSCKSDDFTKITLQSITLATNCNACQHPVLTPNSSGKPRTWSLKVTAYASAKTFPSLSSSHRTGIIKSPFLRRLNLYTSEPFSTLNTFTEPCRMSTTQLVLPVCVPYKIVT